MRPSPSPPPAHPRWKTRRWWTDELPSNPYAWLWLGLSIFAALVGGTPWLWVVVAPLAVVMVPTLVHWVVRLVRRDVDSPMPWYVRAYYYLFSALIAAGSLRYVVLHILHR
jgi:hypothetical protein